MIGPLAHSAIARIDAGQTESARGFLPFKMAHAGGAGSCSSWPGDGSSRGFGFCRGAGTISEAAR